MIEKIFSKYPKIGKHKYLDFYRRHFTGLSPKLLLEIGVASGDSLRAWQDLFPECKIAGIDIDPSCKRNNPNLNIFIGDQKDTIFLQSVFREVGIPDIIIDDGGHKRSQQIESLKFLFPKLNSTGIYVIEDLQVNYLEQWSDQELSTIEYLKSLIDPTGYHGKMKYTSLTFEPTICILRK